MRRREFLKLCGIAPFAGSLSILGQSETKKLSSINDYKSLSSDYTFDRTMPLMATEVSYHMAEARERFKQMQKEIIRKLSDDIFKSMMKKYGHFEFIP